MQFIFKPTLEHIALMKLVTELWNQSDIRALVEEFANTTVFLQVDDFLFFARLLRPECWTGEKEAKWQTIATRVVEKIPQHIVQTLKDKTVRYIKPVGLQILRWMEYHRKCFCLDLKLPSEFCWTLQGIIDRKKTAEVLIKDEDIDIMMRYRLACIYCLGDDIPELWNKIPESLKFVFGSMTDYISDPREISKGALLGFWSQFKRGNVHWENKILIFRGQDSELSEAITSAIVMVNKAAIEYFLPESYDERQRVLASAASLVLQINGQEVSTIGDPPKEYSCEVFCFLLSLMNDEQQSRVFETYPRNVLIPFLEWPLQSFFVELASHQCRMYPRNDAILHGITQVIVRKVKMGYKDCNYQMMYREVWQQLTDDYKISMINSGGLAGIASLFMGIKDSETIKLMFQQLSITERNALISSGTTLYTSRTMAEYEEWDLLNFFVQACVTSKDEMIKFKKRVKEVSICLPKNNQDKLGQILDDLVDGFDKRNSPSGISR